MHATYTFSSQCTSCSAVAKAFSTWMKDKDCQLSCVNTPKCFPTCSALCCVSATDRRVSPQRSNLRSSARADPLATVDGEGSAGLRAHCTDENAEAQGGRSSDLLEGTLGGRVGAGLVSLGTAPQPPSPRAPTHILSAPLRWMKDEFIIDGRNTWEPVRMWISLLS